MRLTTLLPSLSFEKRRKTAKYRNAPSNGSKRKQTAHAKARNSLIAGLVAMLMITVGVNIYGDRHHPEWWDPPYGLREQLLDRAVREHPDKKLLLFLGTSRTANSLCSENFDDIPGLLPFNFGRAAAFPIDLLLSLKRLLLQGIRPDYLMVEILPASLCDPRLPDNIVVASRLRWSEIAAFEPHLKDPAAYRMGWLSERYDPISNARFGLLNSMASWMVDNQTCSTYSQHRPSHPLGWVTLRRELITKKDIKTLRKKAKDTYFESLSSLVVSEEPKHCFEDLITLCRQNGIPIAFYIMPEAPSFRAWYSPKSEAVLADFSNDMRVRFDVPIFDFRKECEESDFVDGHHLWADAAPRTTEKLLKNTILPWVDSLKASR